MITESTRRYLKRMTGNFVFRGSGGVSLYIYWVGDSDKKSWGWVFETRTRAGEALMRGVAENCQQLFAVIENSGAQFDAGRFLGQSLIGTE